jgi:hypothetical protein
MIRSLQRGENAHGPITAMTGNAAFAVVLSPVTPGIVGSASWRHCRPTSGLNPDSEHVYTRKRCELCGSRWADVVVGFTVCARCLAALVFPDPRGPRPPAGLRFVDDAPVAPCRRCSVCEGLEHHWLPDCDDETGDPIMVCKHCPATRDYTDEDDEVDA